VISLTPVKEPVGAHDCSAEAHSLCAGRWGLATLGLAGVEPWPTVLACQVRRRPAERPVLAGLPGRAVKPGVEPLGEFVLDPGLVPPMAGGEADELVALGVVAQDEVDLPG
jgi:hypothetical protein